MDGNSSTIVANDNTANKNNDLDGSWSNDDFKHLPFPIRSPCNLIYRLFQLSNIQTTTELSQIVKHEEELLKLKLGDIEAKIVKQAVVRSVDLEFHGESRQKNLFEKTLDKWEYIGFYAGSPFTHCVCGESTYYLHAIRRKEPPYHRLYVGTDCLEIFTGEMLHGIGQSLEDLFIEPEKPCSRFIINYAKFLKLINDEESTLLQEEYTRWQETSNEMTQSFTEIDKNFVILNAKFKILHRFVREETLFAKIKRMIVFFFTAMQRCVDLEYAILSEEEKDYVDAMYFSKKFPNDTFGRYYVGLTDKKVKGIKLDEKATKGLNIFKDKRQKIDVDTPDHEIIKTNYIQQKNKKLDQLAQKLVEATLKIQSEKLIPEPPPRVRNAPNSATPSTTPLVQPTTIPPSNKPPTPTNTTKTNTITTTQSAPKQNPITPATTPQKIDPPQVTLTANLVEIKQEKIDKVTATTTAPTTTSAPIHQSVFKMLGKSNSIIANILSKQTPATPNNDINNNTNNNNNIKQTNNKRKAETPASELFGPDEDELDASEMGFIDDDEADLVEVDQPTTKAVPTNTIKKSTNEPSEDTFFDEFSSVDDDEALIQAMDETINNLKNQK